MCGLAGYFCPNGFELDEAHDQIVRMTNSLRHRGPDDYGDWIDKSDGIALGHRRLSILDLTTAGHQPMTSASGRYVLAFNGEIYNHVDIRKNIEAIELVAWNGHSDTETLLASFDCWGIEQTLKKTVGMFAIALWDKKNRTLTLARDRMGEKPLYYGWQQDTLIFGSELKALRQHSSFLSNIEHDVIETYLKQGYIHSPHSIYKGIRKLIPGTFIQFTIKDKPGLLPKPVHYWSLFDSYSRGIEAPFLGTNQDAVAELESLLIQSISQQRVADVSVGAFLSGGLDSSLVVAIMQSISSMSVQTFTIGFDEKDYNEADKAESIAKFIGTEHTTLYVSQNDILDKIISIPELYDEPFSDVSASSLVSQLASQNVKVSLSGDGGDELFGGYDHYHMTNRLRKKYKKLPNIMGSFLAPVIQSIPPPILSFLFDHILSLRGRAPSMPSGIRLHQLAELLKMNKDIDFYRALKSRYSVESSLIHPSIQLKNSIKEEYNEFDIVDFQELMMFEDASRYLTDDILVKVDRTSMAVSLENRAPLLDHRIVEFSHKIPLDLKLHKGQGKRILREVSERYIDKNLTNHPKMGFNLPGAEWLRGPLKSWATELLSEDNLNKHNIFNSNNVQKMLGEHMSEKYNWQALLWRLLAFQVWLNKERI